MRRRRRPRGIVGFFLLLIELFGCVLLRLFGLAGVVTVQKNKIHGFSRRPELVGIEASEILFERFAFARDARGNQALVYAFARMTLLGA